MRKTPILASEWCFEKTLIDSILLEFMFISFICQNKEVKVILSALLLQ